MLPLRCFLPIHSWAFLQAWNVLTDAVKHRRSTHTRSRLACAFRSSVVLCNRHDEVLHLPSFASSRLSPPLLGLRLIHSLADELAATLPPSSSLPM